MKIQTTKKELLAALSAVRNAASEKSSLAILANVLIESDGSEVRLSATDMQVSLSAVVNGAESDSGCVAVGARVLFDVIKNAADGSVTMDVDDGVMVVKAGRSRFKLPTMPGDDFPKLPKSKGDYVPVSGDMLASILGLTHYAAAEDTTRAHLYGVLLTATGNRLTAMASNGAVGAMAGHVADGVGEFTVFVHARGVLELRAVAAEGDINISIDAAYLFVRSGSKELAIKLGENEFPPLGKLIDSCVDGATQRFVVGRTAMLDTLRRMDVVAGGKTVPMVCADFTTGTITMSGASHEVGEGNDALDTDYAGDDFRIAFSPRLMVEMLTALSDDDVSMAVGSDPLVPIVITSDAGCDFVGIIMPMREPAA